VPDSNDLPEKYAKLLDEFQQLESELQRAKRSLEIKEIELKAVLAQAHEVSNTDALTFLPNRRKIIVSLQEEVIRSNRYGMPLSISILDIDHFKKINDTYGHTTGDEALRNLAARLREQIRHPDIIGRYGGEEFLIVLPNSEAEAAAEQASRLCQHVRTMEVESNDQTLFVTISVGVAQYRIGQENWEQFLNRADAALYQAKDEGRDRWVVAEG
jgi:diguanylate cyclase (GGDEF)-like protein